MLHREQECKHFCQMNNLHQSSSGKHVTVYSNTNFLITRLSRKGKDTFHSQIKICVVPKKKQLQRQVFLLEIAFRHQEHAGKKQHLRVQQRTELPGPFPCCTMCNIAAYFSVLFNDSSSHLILHTLILEEWGKDHLNNALPI